MPRPRSSLPGYCLHKASGQAVAYVNRRPIYLSAHDSADSRKRYGELLSRLAQGLPIPTLRHSSGEPGAGDAVLVNSLCLRYATEALPRYSQDEQHCQRGAIRVLRHLFGETEIADFGPVKLRLVRDAMVEKGWSRSFINKQIHRHRRIFRFGVGWELVPAQALEGLRALDSLRAGDSDAQESRPRSAVSESELAAVRELLTGVWGDLFDLMLLTGARPGELVSLTTGMIERTGEVWRCELRHHKTAHMNKQRVLFFTPAAQAILARHLKADPDARLFPVRRVAFGKAVSRACEVAFGMPKELRNVTKTVAKLKDATDAQRAEAKERLSKEAATWRREHCWTPHWLRHTVATKLADEMGTEAAQRLLGHSSIAMTLHYSRAADRTAIEAAKRLG